MGTILEFPKKGCSFSITLTRPPVEDGTTEHDVAVLIKQLDPQDPKWDSKVYALIKRCIHYQKHSVYSRIYTYGGFCPDSDMSEFVELKIRTHAELYAKLSEELQ